MNLATRHFGKIDIDASKILFFNEGIPGFTDYKRYILLSEPEEEQDTDNVFYWLQSVDDGDICFVLMNVAKIMPDYNPLVEEAEISGLGEYDPECFNFYNITKFPENMRDATVNLKAPIVINSDSKVGKQVICKNDEYTVNHYVFR